LFDKSQRTLIRCPQAKTGSYTIPNGVTAIGNSAFSYCTSLTNITIPASVTYIGYSAFWDCINLIEIYFEGNAPSFSRWHPFGGDDITTVYYLPGTIGWGPTFEGRPTAPWSLPNPLILSNSPFFGVQTNRFGFIISWATNLPVVVEACADLANPDWFPLSTNNLAGGSSYFSDPDWTNHPARFYRLRSR
jgi:hypothetical protein